MRKCQVMRDICVETYPIVEFRRKKEGLSLMVKVIKLYSRSQQTIVAVLKQFDKVRMHNLGEETSVFQYPSYTWMNRERKL